MPDTPTPDAGLLDSRQAAAYLAISQPTLYRLRRSGDLPYVRVHARSIRYRSASLERWAAQREECAVEGPADQD